MRGGLTKVVSRMKKAGSKLVFIDDNERKRFDVVVGMLPEAEFRMIVELYDARKEEERKRTENQNRYYHKLLDIICEFTGDDHLDMHDKLKAKFLGRPYVLDNKEYIIVPSTTSLNSKNFGEYLEKIFAYVSEEYELILPSPSDYY